MVTHRQNTGLARTTGTTGTGQHQFLAVYSTHRPANNKQQPPSARHTRQAAALAIGPWSQPLLVSSCAVAVRGLPRVARRVCAVCGGVRAGR